MGLDIELWRVRGSSDVAGRAPPKGDELYADIEGEILP